MAKKETPPSLERIFTIPLRREYQKAPNWKRTEKAVVAVKQFLQKHMKSDSIKVGASVNELLWKHGIKNPPHHVKVVATKDKEGVVKAELFGMQEEKPKKEKKVKETKAAPKIEA